MRHLAFTTTLLALALTGATAFGDPKPPPKPPPPPSPYPMSADSFRARIDRLIDARRQACARVKECPKDYIESGISQLKLRTLEACRDGVVTKQEAEWVMEAAPNMPEPAPPPPRPGPDPDDD